MAPPEATPSFLPAPTTMINRLPDLVVARLEDVNALVTRKTPEWDVVLSGLDKNGGFVGMNSWEVNNLIHCVAVNQRAALSEKLLGMMSAAGVLPDTLTFDLLMLAHAEVKNPEEVKRLFRDMREREKQPLLEYSLNQDFTDKIIRFYLGGLPPTVYSYGHLLKAHSQLSDVFAATHAVEEMHTHNILPNLIVYTTLIQTCISRNQLETAWQIFNLIKLKSTATAPDVTTYTLMIHACAINDEVERALDLFTDMTVRRGLVPNRETYHALIHACAMRKDYFTQAWKFATDMQQDGMTINRIYLNVLIQACGRTGELTRARLLVRHMMASSRERKNVQPDEITFQNLMRTYATYQAPGTGAKKVVGGTRRTVSEPAFVGAGTGQLEKRTDGEAAEEEIPFLAKSVLQTHNDVLQEAKQVLAWIRKERSRFVSTQLLNAYLDVCQNQGGFAPAKRCYDKYFSVEEPAKEETAEEKIGKPMESEEQISDEVAEEDDEKTNEGEPPSPPASESSNADTSDREFRQIPKSPPPPPPPPRQIPPRNIHTFEIALHVALRNRDLSFARRVIVDRNNFKLTKTYWSMFPEERKKYDFQAECIMIDILARCQFLGEAAERVRKTWESGEWEWKEKHLKTLYVRAVQCEDWTTVDLCQRISGKLDRRY